jgi:ABC-type lipoprotein release transport system permease subunit
LFVTAVRLRGRALMRRRWRAWVGLAVVLGAFGGVALALAEGADRTSTAYPNFVRAQNAADVVLAGRSEFGLVGNIDLSNVAKSPDIRPGGYAEAFSPLPFSATTSRSDTPLGVADLLLVASVDRRLGQNIETWKMLDGRPADPDRVDEATASFELMERLGLQVGDTIRFHFYDAKNFTSTALQLLTDWPKRLDALRTNGDTSVRDPADGPFVEVTIVGVEAAPLEFPPVLTDLAPILHLTPKFNALYSDVVVGSPVAFIRLKNPEKLEQFQLSVEEQAKGNPVSFISSLRNQQPKVQRSVRAEALILTLLAGLVAFAGIVALAQALTRQVFSESGDDETLRALGMDRNQFLAVALLRSAFIGGVGAAIACGIGWLLAPSLLLSLADTANLQEGFPVDAFAMAMTVLAVFGFSMIVGVVAFLLVERSLRRGRRPVQAASARVRLADPLAQSWLPLSAVLGVRFAIQRARRSLPAWTGIAGVALCVAVLTFAITFTEHLQRDLGNKHRHGWNWDVKIGSPALPDIADPLVPALTQQPGLTDLSVGATTQMEVGGKRVDVLALDKVVGEAYPTIIAGRQPVSEKEIVLGERTMRQLDTGLGRIIAAKIGQEKRTYLVVGTAVFPEFGDSGQLGTGSLMTIEGLRNVLPTAPRDTFYVWYQGAPDAAARAARLSEVLSPLPSKTDALPEDLVNLSRSDASLALLGVMLGFLALTMLVHTLMTGARNGRRNHATLRALGYSRGQSRITVLWHSLTLAAASLLVGLPLGLVAGRFVWGAYANRLGILADPFFPMEAIVAGAAGVLVVGVLASIPPGWFVNHTDVPTTLRAAD